MIHLPRLCLPLACLLLTYTSSARVEKEHLKSYKAAKKYYAASNYAAAKAALEPLMDVEAKNDLTPYALFYYALSAYYHQEATLAERTFTTLVEEFPDWEQYDEVWYWLGQLRFEAQDYRGGVACLANITDKRLAKPVGKMKTYFLQQLDDTATLQMLLKLYPEDQVIAQVLFDQITHQPLLRRDFALLNTLGHDFNLALREHDPLKSVSSWKKDSYNVAVFFPFFVHEVDYEEESSNLFVIALYQGIKAAVAALADQGIQINLFAYDTKKDPTTTAALLAQEEIKGMDLIIGPLYAATIPLVADFARKHQINVFNPLSENAEVVGDNPFVFLFKSSLETQARKAAEFTLQNAPEAISVGIIYGTSEADSIQAHTYKQHIERSTGQEVALMLPIAPEEAQNFLHELRAEAEEEVDEVQAEGQGEANEEQAPLSLASLTHSLASLTHIYVASKNELIAANVLSAVEMLNLNPCIVGHEAWLQQSSLTLDQLQRLRLHLVAPDHIDYKRAGIYDFRSYFYDQFAQYPTSYACTGYDMMLFLGHMLDQHGVYFQKHWGAQLYPGAIYEGVAYSIYHDNQYVPIVKLQNNTFLICNQDKK